jgi:hypothetical protein
MSTGQSLLALGAVVLLSFLALNVNRIYVASMGETARFQQNLDAINYAQSLSDAIYAHSINYAGIDSIFGALNNVNSPAGRVATITPMGDSLYATIVFAAEQPVSEGVNGRLATIRVFERQDAQFRQLVESTATLINMEE